MKRFLLPLGGSAIAAALALVPACSSSDDSGGSPDASSDAPSDVVVGDVGPGDSAPPDDTGASDAGPPPPPSFDWTAFVGTGGDLAVGVGATPVIDVTQPFTNKKLLDQSPDPKYDGNGDQLTLAPLVAPIRPFFVPFADGGAVDAGDAGDAGDGGNGGVYPDDSYPNDIFGETPNESMGNQIAQSVQDTEGRAYVTLQSVVGARGRSLPALSKGGASNAYASSLYEARAFQAFAQAQKKTLGYGAIVLSHGDEDAASATYGADLAKLRSDYENDLRTITGQTSMIPMILAQESVGPTSTTALPLAALAQWKQAQGDPYRFLVAGPLYPYEFGSDHAHLTTADVVRLGEKYAEAYVTQQVSGNTWHPVVPTHVSFDASAPTLVLIDFDVAFAPLNFDPLLPPPHQSAHPEWAAAKGFEMTDEQGAVPITSVEIQETSVLLHLGRTPTKNAVVRYAATADTDAPGGGLGEGRHGLLRDSDPFVGRDQQQIACTVKDGSAVVTAMTPGGFAARSLRDLVSGAKLPPDTAIIARSGDTITLNHPYDGADGQVVLTIRHEQRNYALTFEMPVD